jgi:hypothetical protein
VSKHESALVRLDHTRDSTGRAVQCVLGHLMALECSCSERKPGLTDLVLRAWSLRAQRKDEGSIAAAWLNARGPNRVRLRTRSVGRVAPGARDLAVRGHRAPSCARSDHARRVAGVKARGPRAGATAPVDTRRGAAILYWHSHIESAKRVESNGSTGRPERARSVEGNRIESPQALNLGHPGPPAKADVPFNQPRRRTPPTQEGSHLGQGH